MSVLFNKFRKKFAALEDADILELLEDMPENEVEAKALQEVADERGIGKKGKGKKAAPPAKASKSKKVEEEEEEEEESEEEEEEEEAPKSKGKGKKAAPPAKASKSKKVEEEEEEETEEEEEEEEEAPKSKGKKVAPPAKGKGKAKADDDEEPAGKRGRKPAADAIPEKKFKAAYEVDDNVQFAATARQEQYGYTPGKLIKAKVTSVTRCPRTGLAYYKLEFKDKNTKEICKTSKLESSLVIEE